MESQLISRKRNRPSLVCLACKKRKIRCDKKRPCSSCVRSNTVKHCIYDSNWLVDGNHEAEDNQDSLDKAIENSKVPVSLVQPPPNKKPNIKTEVKDGLQKNKLKEDLVQIRRSELNTLMDRLIALELKQHKTQPDPTRSAENVKLDSPDSDIIDVNYYDMHFKYKTLLYPTPVFLNASKHQALNISGTFLDMNVLHDPKFPGFLPEKTTGSDSQGKKSPKSLYPLLKGYQLGVNPFQNEEETISLYEVSKFSVSDDPDVHNDAESSMIGPFAWFAVLKKDFWLAILRRYCQDQKAKSRLNALDLVRNADQYHPSPVSSNGSLLNPSFLSNLQSPISTASKELSDLPRPAFLANSISGDSESKVDNSYEDFARRELNDNLEDDMPFVIDNDNANQLKSSVNKNPKLKATVFDELDHYGTKIIDQILSVLPKKKALWLLVKKFFCVLYPFFPFLDEFDFRMCLEKIFGPECYEDKKITLINIVKRIDFSTIGILLVVIRLSYVSLFSNRIDINESRLNVGDSISPKAHETRYLLLNPILLQAIDVAHLCLNQFALLKKGRLPVLQCALYIRIYHCYAPEDGNGIDDAENQIFHGMLVQMAYSLGLNREMRDVKNSNIDKRKNNLRRKIWAHLCTEDFDRCYASGTFLSINSDYYNTLPPFTEPGNSNLRDVQLDDAVNNTFKFNEAFLKGPTKHILRLVLKIDSQAKMSELTKYINHAEVGSFASFGRLIDYIKPLESNEISYSSSKILKVSICLKCKLFFMILAFYFVSYYDEKGNPELRQFYITKMFSLVVEEVMPVMLPFIFKSESCFGEGANLKLNPNIQFCIHRCNELLIIGLCRNTASVYQLEGDPEHYEKLKNDAEYRQIFEKRIEISNIMIRCSQIFLFSAYVLSNRYYFAWTIEKAHSFMLSVVTNEEFYGQMAELKNVDVCDCGALEQLVAMGKSGMSYLEKWMEVNCKPINLESMFKSHDELLYSRRGNKDSYVSIAKRRHELNMSKIKEEESLSRSHEQESIPRFHKSGSDSKSPIPFLLNPSDQIFDKPKESNSKEYEGSILPRDFANIPNLNLQDDTPGANGFLNDWTPMQDEFENFNNYKSMPEVDSSWLQLLAQKNQQQDGSSYNQADNSQNHANKPAKNHKKLTANGDSPATGNYRKAFDSTTNPIDKTFFEIPSDKNLAEDQIQDALGSKYFDLFSDLPLDQIFYPSR